MAKSPHKPSWIEFRLSVDVRLRRRHVKKIFWILLVALAYLLHLTGNDAAIPFPL